MFANTQTYHFDFPRMYAYMAILKLLNDLDIISYQDYEKFMALLTDTNFILNYFIKDEYKSLFHGIVSI
jgi:hypothetical protein